VRGIGLYGLTMAAGTLGMFLRLGPGRSWAARARLTLAFTTFVLFQFFNIFNARAEHGSAFNASSSATASCGCRPAGGGAGLAFRPRPSSTP
jgi:hypothetical protein